MVKTDCKAVLVRKNFSILSSYTPAGKTFFDSCNMTIWAFINFFPLKYSDLDRLLKYIILLDGKSLSSLSFIPVH